jgi:hypothetical protein
MPRIRSVVGVTLLSLTSPRHRVYFIGFKASYGWQGLALGSNQSVSQYTSVLCSSSS